MPTGRSFYVSGSIRGDKKIPENSTIEVEMFDEKNNMIRHVVGRNINSTRYYISKND